MREMAGDRSLQALQQQDGDEPLWALQNAK